MGPGAGQGNHGNAVNRSGAFYELDRAGEGLHLGRIGILGVFPRKTVA